MVPLNVNVDGDVVLGADQKSTPRPASWERRDSLLPQTRLQPGVILTDSGTRAHSSGRVEHKNLPFVHPAHPIHSLGSMLGLFH